MDENKSLMRRSLRLYITTTGIGLAVTVLGFVLSSNMWLILFGMMTMIASFGYLSMAGTLKALDKWGPEAFEPPNNPEKQKPGQSENG
jgi:hypothetical protein